MDRKSANKRLNLLGPLLVLAGLLVLAIPLKLAAQVPVDDNGEPLQALDPFDYVDPAGPVAQPMTAAELEDLVGPIALYPDDLLAIVLPASTYPLEIVQAVRFLDELGTDSSLKPDESWDESVIALLNYPEVVYMMDKEIDWTWRLGEAVINQQADILAAVESFRDRAYAAGNLESDEHQTVSNDEGIIEIAPVDEEIIYVPYYEPEEVLVDQPRRVYYYYPQAYPVYYYPYPVGYSFASGYFWGVTTAYTIGWSNRNLHVYHPTYWGHPYYGRYYYGHYYRRPSISVYNNWYVHNSYRSSQHRHRDGDHWRPRKRSGARPATQRVRNRHERSTDRDNSRSVDRQAYADRRAAQRNATNNDTRSRSDGAANRTRQSTSRQRTRTAAANRGTVRRDRRGNSEFRFRDRSDAERTRANRGSNTGQNNSSRPASNANSSADRQRLVAQSSRRANANTRAQQSRRVNQRNTAAQQARVTGTQSRGASSQRATAQRPTAQRPASQPNVQRQASRPNVQRQAPAQRQSSNQGGKRQSGKRQSNSSGKRSRSRTRTKRQN